MQKILKIAAKCKSHGITKFFISNFFSTRKLSRDVIYNVNFSVFKICKEHQFYYIDNSNIYGELLYKDGLHLLYVGKELLTKNFVVSINNFFGKCTNHPKIYLGRMT